MKVKGFNYAQLDPKQGAQARWTIQVRLSKDRRRQRRNLRERYDERSEG